jgi:hypothetical protein
MAVPKDRVDYIGVIGQESVSFRKAVLLGPLNLEEEGHAFLQNVGKFFSMDTASHCKILHSSKTLLGQPRTF